jgi:hypothetical protein
MSESKAWWRTGAGIAAWLVLAVTTAGIAWAAVAVVADQGDDPASVSVPDSTPAAQTRSSQDGADPSADPLTGSDKPADGGTRVITSAGGSASVTCTGPASITLQSTSPAAGWQLEESESKPDEVRVEFSRANDGGVDERIRAHCQGGVIRSELD